MKAKVSLKMFVLSVVLLMTCSFYLQLFLLYRLLLLHVATIIN